MQNGIRKTVIATAESSEHKNSSMDPDEAIRQRLAELRTSDSSKDKGVEMCNIILWQGSPEVMIAAF